MSSDAKTPGDEPPVGGSIPAPGPSRRGFFHGLTIGLSGLVAAALAIPWVAFFLSPAARSDPRAWRRVGRVAAFHIGATVKVTFMDPTPLPWAGFAAENAAWVRRESVTEFVAFTIYCTHVGCPVRWAPGAELFMCPCHGGAFGRDGAVVAGPPPRPLDRYPVRVRNGYLEIQTFGVPRPGGRGRAGPGGPVG